MTHNKDIIILGIESSCDETSAAILQNNNMLSNVIANQKVHQNFGGVVPELASRAHQQNIIPVVDQAIKESGINKKDIDAVAFTRGPGLLGALLVGTSFAKSLALSLDKPLISVNHMQAHILAHFIGQLNTENKYPNFPFLCLTVSGGHTQIVLVKTPLEMQILGETIDDAAGEAFDKSAKILGLPYPGGPLIDKYAKEGNPKKFVFTKPKAGDLNYSFSGLKTNILYFIKDKLKENPEFISQNLNDLCASIQECIVEILMINFEKAILLNNVKDIAISGGVSANSRLRKAIIELAEKHKISSHIPDFQFCTDNAAMIAMGGYYLYKESIFSNQDITPLARMDF
jgi:N6-L-threonylcarbamoyladenine synthase